MYPYTAYEDSYIHNAFENAGATLSGVETAYHVLKKKGKLDETYKFITFGGDGGTIYRHRLWADSLPESVRLLY